MINPTPLPAELWTKIGSFLTPPQRTNFSHASRFIFSLLNTKLQINRPAKGLCSLLKNVKKIVFSEASCYDKRLASQLKSLKIYNTHDTFFTTSLREGTLSGLIRLTLLHLSKEILEDILPTVAAQCGRLEKLKLTNRIDTLPIFPNLKKIFVPMHSETLQNSLKAQPCLESVSIWVDSLEFLKWVDPSYKIHFIWFDSSIYTLPDSELIKLKFATHYYYGLKKPYQSFLSYVLAELPLDTPFVLKCLKMGFPLDDRGHWYLPEMLFIKLISKFPFLLIKGKFYVNKPCIIYQKLANNYPPFYLLYLLKQAIMMQKKELVRGLLFNPAISQALKLKNEKGDNFFHILSKDFSDNGIEMNHLNPLNDKGIDLDGVNNEGLTPLENAIMHKRDILIRYFVSINAKIRFKTWALALEKKLFEELYFAHKNPREIEFPLSHNEYKQNIYHIAFYNCATPKSVLKITRFDKTLPLLFEKDSTEFTPLTLGLNRCKTTYNFPAYLSTSHEKEVLFSFLNKINQ